MHRWLSALESDVFLKTDRIRVPQPLGLSGALHMLLYDYVDGVDLRHAVDDNKPFALAAHWLARLHDARPLAELKVRTIQHDVAKSIQWIKAVQPALSASNGTRLARMHNLLERLPTTPPDELRMIHRDYYYANLLWDGSSLWALDIDQLRLGEPALDVAHFSAHLQVLAYRQTGDFAAYDERMHHFLNTYRQARPTSDAFGRLPFYTAYTFLKLAATEVDRARDGWRDAAEVFAARACDALDGRA
jgi:Ser/Thr protein kinase RdoA (MazF antagonist)